MQDWRPTATIENLRRRAQVFAELRAFFAARNVIEVDVPALSQRATSDPHIDSITATCGGNSAYLATSPEFGLKRLLAAGMGDCYYLGKAFRNGEAGSRHNPEFTMLEWYRVGWDDHQLMDEVAALLCGVLQLPAPDKLSYRALFQSELGVDPHSATVSELRQLARSHFEIEFESEAAADWLDLLMSHVLEPRLGTGVTLVYDFPASQAALAKVEPDALGVPVARRFEAYVGGVELANGYWELTDAAEQHRRFEADHAYRRANGLPAHPFEERLVEALALGDMPECAGVALGVERLLMQKLGAGKISEVLALPFERA
ncbi:EF-P lysine aminoacylase EpmA [Biformimicrobium ophioploci]|uniref:EF-P lysine aminoacylase EpmA n=1 Tax=Biformimicrobium ophioploci TaxID=3036711 RepID=A0ABQ6LUN2_9GAMM|nr:EF-P lysine aminoacylase EpmA [Microbulbifer sp. NKW57]GMG85794.1 EF-P lysine aminoacylase EpmA [Microbulbifer sp. NKW57]